MDLEGERNQRVGLVSRAVILQAFMFLLETFFPNHDSNHGFQYFIDFAQSERDCRRWTNAVTDVICLVSHVISIIVVVPCSHPRLDMVRGQLLALVIGDAAQLPSSKADNILDLFANRAVDEYCAVSG